MTNKEKRIEKWQWWLLVAWLLFIAVVGFIVLFRLSSIRMAAPPPLPAGLTEFKLGDGPEIEIRGRVLMPDGSPAPKGASISISNITYAGLGVGSVLTDEGGYYSAKANVGAKVTAIVSNHPLKEPCVFPALATTVVEHPEPGRYDIRAIDDPIRVYGKLRGPDAASVSAGRSLIAQAYVFGRAPVVLSRDAAGKVHEETVKMYFSASTDDDGSYEIFLPPGEYDIEADGRLYEGAPYEEITLVSGDADREIDFTVRQATRFRFVLPDGVEAPRKTTYVQGTMISEDGNLHFSRNYAQKPDEDAEILLSRAGTHIVAEATTKSGSYGVVLTFLGVERTEPMTVTLQPAARAKIRIVDEKDGVPLVGAQISCGWDFHYYRAGNSGETTRTGYKSGTETDENGVAILEPLYIGGEYRIISVKRSLPFEPSFYPVEGGKLYDLGDWKVPAYWIEYAARGQKPEDTTPPEQENNTTETSTKPGEQGHDE